MKPNVVLNNLRYNSFYLLYKKTLDRDPDKKPGCDSAYIFKSHFGITICRSPQFQFKKSSHREDGAHAKTVHVYINHMKKTLISDGIIIHTI